ncbi:MAG: DUF4405 domain-containing protein [Eggerthellaceae bacterium]|nr:DUF4405 domain-containing protein [Eggerthellaceae bacterium]
MAKRDGKAIARILVDVLLAVCFVAVMATALVEEAPHEFLGLALFAFIVVHVVLNRRWFTALAKGRYTVVRVLQVVSVIGLVVCVVGQAVSALILSKHALAFLPALPGASWARQVHMLCSYWSFAFAFAHMGLQFKTMLSRMGGLRNAPQAVLWLLRIVWLAVAVFGSASFTQLGIADYLFARIQFASADYDAPLALSFARYASIAALIAGCFHYLRVLLGRRR